MNKKLLITGSFFVFESNVTRLKEAGYEVIRLEQPSATQDELIEALRGVSVYIIGGTEQVTDAVIASTDSLETIIFNGVDYDKFIPAAEAAQRKGIKILNAPGANAIAVAEFGVGVAIAMQRDLFGIGRTGDKKFQTTRSIQGSTVGLIGAGNVAKAIIAGIKPFAPADILYSNRTQREISARMVELEELVSASDILFVTLPMKAGMVLNSDMIAQVKPGCLIVNLSPMGLIDFGALLPRLQKGELRCAVDWPAPSPEFEQLPMDTWFHVHSHSAYNTAEAIRSVSDSVTDTAIGLLQQI
jgi:phosphoglycerate dehydrogenase-like enzyme